MEETNQVAAATYETLSKKEKREIKALFRSIDKNGDGKISAEELKEFLKENGHEAKAGSNIFSLIDQNQDGYLQFDEVVTLLYVIESNRPVCNHCKAFIPGAFFICTDCHCEKPAKDSYNLCIDCYNRGEFVHEHAEFLDNYTLFSEMREKLQASSSTSETNQPKSRKKASSSPSTSETNQPKSGKREKLKKAFKALTGCAAVGSFVATCVPGG